MSFTPTEEQAAIATAMKNGDHLVVQAGAGTGKTSTIAMLADIAADHNITGLYLAFNKAIARDVQGKLNRGNVIAKTFHSVAYHIARNHPFTAPLMDKLNSDTALRPYELPRHIGFDGTLEVMTWADANKKDTGREYTTKLLKPHNITGYALASLNKWCQSADDDINETHVVYPKGVVFRAIDHNDNDNDTDDNRADTRSDPKQDYITMVLDVANKLWEDIISPSGRVRFSHDYYLKLVSLMHPNFVEALGLPPGSIIFFDEAQDARPCMTSIVRDQTKPQGSVLYGGQYWDPRMQVITVGDSSQAIYGSFTGARDALPEFETLPDAKTLPLTTSWRFGPVVADKANEVLDILDAPIRLKGNPNKQSTVHTYTTVPDVLPDAVLVRTNAELIREILHYQSLGLSVHAEVDAKHIIGVANDIDRLSNGDKPRTADMKIFDTYEEIDEYIGSEFADPQLAALLKIIIQSGTDQVRDAFEYAADEKDSDVTISTIHKSKGRQWGTVRVALEAFRDVPRVIPETIGEREKLMLIYVAMTRATDVLYFPADVDEALRSLSIAGQWEPEYQNED